jgi:hypothetical protein
MKRLAFIAIVFVAGLSLWAGTAKAQTVEELQRELAARMLRSLGCGDACTPLETGGAVPVRTA